jgi:hypothetical protein
MTVATLASTVTSMSTVLVSGSPGEHAPNNISNTKDRNVIILVIVSSFLIGYFVCLKAPSIRPTGLLLMPVSRAIPL